MSGRLQVLTNASEGRAPLQVVAAALSAGAPVAQVRAKGCTDRELYDFALRVVGLCARSGAACEVDDRPDVALAVGAAGTHPEPADLPLRAARPVVGADHLLGGSAREPVRAGELVAEGADYLGAGPAYATATKAGLPAPLGAAGVGAVAAVVQLPVIAIGGVTAARVPELPAAGAAGVAVVGAVWGAADPAAAVRELLQALEAAP